MNPLARRVEELEREKDELERQLEHARAVIDVPKKLSEILALEQSPEATDEGNK